MFSSHRINDGTGVSTQMVKIKINEIGVGSVDDLRCLGDADILKGIVTCVNYFLLRMEVKMV